MKSIEEETKVLHVKYGLSQKHLEIIRDILSNHKQISRCLLFGSRARDEYKKASDVDLAIDGEVDIKLVATLKDEFEESDLPYFVDIVNYQKASDKLRKNIDKDGVLI